MGDCNTSIYYEGNALPTVLLKVEALQAMDKHEEAVSELEMCYEPGSGKEDPQVRSKLQEAQRLLKKSKRVNLYEVLGCTRGELSSEKEIATAYKKMALKWHPDRHSSKSEAERKKAEDEFKKIGDAHELLTDPQRRQLTTRATTGMKSNSTWKCKSKAAAAAATGVITGMVVIGALLASDRCTTDVCLCMRYEIMGWASPGNGNILDQVLVRYFIVGGAV